MTLTLALPVVVLVLAAVAVALLGASLRSQADALEASAQRLRVLRVGVDALRAQVDHTGRHNARLGDGDHRPPGT